MSSTARGTRIHRFAATLSVALAACLSPPLFERLFAPSFLFASDRAFLWALVPLPLVAAGALIRMDSALHPRLLAVYLGLLAVVFAELGVRLVVCTFVPDARTAVARMGRLAYPQLAAYSAHPFAQFRGTSGTGVVEDRVLSGLGSFNNYGFIGPDFVVAKPANVVRVAALGGSTTATGYPALLEDHLNERLPDGAVRVEALNFGLGWYTTAHSLANFVFTVRDFAPDYVVIHHATNEKEIRGGGAELRGDYSNRFKPFDPPLLGDWLPMRLSIVYRYLRFRTAPRPTALDLRAATLSDPTVPGGNFDDLSELEPFERNIRTIIDLALLDGAKPVLTTQPYRSEPLNEWEIWSPHMEQANDVLRRVAAAYGDRILFVDLDRAMTGSMDASFTDLVHVDADGRIFKARAVGDSILRDLTGADVTVDR